METLKKVKIEIALMFYWLIHAANCIRVSREPGYYPPAVREHARMIAESYPYPWSEIFIAWVALAIVNAGIYLILRKSKNAISHVMLYSGLLLIAFVMIRPTDTGGIDYAIVQYGGCTFLIALCCAIFVSIKRRKA